MNNDTYNAEPVEALFHSGRFADVLRVLLPFLARGAVSTEHRLLMARAMLHAGDTNSAKRIAAEANDSHSGAALRSRCELILGIAAKREGDLSTARRRLQHSVHLAREAGDIKQEAWSQVSLFRLFAEGEPHELLSAVLAETRKLVTRAADAHLAAYLHDSVSVLEAQTGRFDEARRHLDIAESIIGRFPNAWIEQVVHISRLCLACLECDRTTAAAHARKARKLREMTGGYGGEFNLDINEAYINLFTGKFERGYASLQRVVQEGQGLAKLAALEALARMHLTLNRLDDCEATLDLVNGTDVDQTVANCFSARWAATTRAKLLMRRGSLDLAIEFLRGESLRANALADRSLLTTLTFLEAEALAQRGDFAKGNVKLFEAAASGTTRFREYLGHYFNACSRVLGANSSPLARPLRARALRVWHAEGNVWAVVESDSHGGPTLEIRDMDLHHPSASHSPTNTGGEMQLTVASVLDSVAAALDLSFDPRLVCAELTTLVQMIGCSQRFRVVERPARPSMNRPSREDDSHVGAILGSPNSTSIELHCSPSEDAVPNLALSSIVRIARAADALGRTRIEERTRAALWPAEAAEHEESLFISDEMTSLAVTARKVAPTTVPILITGETGTGKEILARAIHAASTRAKATFLPFNCSSGPRDMIDAQLFGHRRGAFTGATEHAPGVVRAAAGGTLFLDEIGEAPLDIQPKLLRFLESGEIHPVGEPHPAKVDVRVIAATNVDLDAAVSTGRFREDLFYRLNIVRLHLPALRERRVEIPVFAQHYLRKHAREFGKGNLRLAEETMEYLLLYKWPGNVRQLANEMRRMAALAENDAVLMPEHLSPDIVASRRTVPASERTLDSNELVVRLDQPLAAAAEHLERAIIPYALKRCEGRVEEAAQILGISRKGLYLKRLRLRLDVQEPHARTA